MAQNNPGGKYEKYGEAHREARRSRMDRVGKKCEVTGERDNLQGHHVQPKSLDIVGQGTPEFESNYMILAEHFHAYLHEITRSEADKGQLIYKRQELVKKIWADPKDHESMRLLRDVDEVLYKEFVEKMLSNLKHNVREKVIELTLVSFLATNRDLKVSLRDKDIDLETAQKVIEAQNFEIEQLRAELAAPIKEREREVPRNNIIDISHRFQQKYE